MNLTSTVYLDNNATTAVVPEVIAAMQPYFTHEFGNPSSLHQFGVKAERGLRTARHTMAQHFHAKDHEIVFTSGGSESISLGIKGAAYALKRKGMHIITAETEHEAVLATINQLTQAGFTVSFAAVDQQGRVSPESVYTLMTDETILVAIMHANNELGTINPIEAIARIVKLTNRNTRVFVDGVQAFGKLNLELQDIDLYAVSGHKLHAPKGVGVLYVREGTPLQPQIVGGGQEFGLRSGTENVPGIVGLACATDLAYQQLSQHHTHLEELKLYFVDRLKNLADITINSPSDGLVNTINVSFLGIPSQVMMHSLEEKKIYVSAGSACSSAKRKQSHVLRAAGFSMERIQSAIRFSFSRYQTQEEIDYVLKAISEVVRQVGWVKALRAAAIQ